MKEQLKGLGKFFGLLAVMYVVEFVLLFAALLIESGYYPDENYKSFADEPLFILSLMTVNMFVLAIAVLSSFKTVTKE